MKKEWKIWDFFVKYFRRFLVIFFRNEELVDFPQGKIAEKRGMTKAIPEAVKAQDVDIKKTLFNIRFDIELHYNIFCKISTNKRTIALLYIDLRHLRLIRNASTNNKICFILFSGHDPYAAHVMLHS